MTEHQLRKALGAANDLEPPTDELFAQRALQRGRARTARRRNAIVGTAAGFALVVLGGGTWLVGQSLQGGVSTSSGSAERMADSGGSAALGTSAPGQAAGAPTVSGVAPARDESMWLAGVVTPQRRAIDALVPTLTTTYPDVFGGAYATDQSNTHIVVTVTRHDAALEAMVTSSMPSPGDVSFEVVANTAVRKQQVADQVLADARGWLAKGLPIVDVRPDARADRVLVTVLSVDAVSALESHYGPDIVRARMGPGVPLGAPSTGVTLPTLQR